MILNTLQREIHENAVAHGWWDEPRTFGDVIALCHSELTEALWAFWKNEPMVWYGEDGKPEGVAVEMADCIIRILDWAGHEDGYIDEIVTERMFYLGRGSGWWYEPRTFAEVVALCHAELTGALEAYRRGHTDWGTEPFSVAMGMADCIARILAWANANDLDMGAIIRDKHEYNKTRPYRHGGKAL